MASEKMTEFREACNDIGQRWIGPLYRASISAMAGLGFGLLPLWITWIRLLIRGEFGLKYGSTLSKGDVLMVACSIAGSALVLGFRKRDPETLPLPELFGVIGVGIVLFCSFVSIEASPEYYLSNQFTQGVVFNLTVVFLPLSMLYAIFMTWQAERSFALKTRSLESLRRAYDVNGDSLNLSFRPRDSHE